MNSSKDPGSGRESMQSEVVQASFFDRIGYSTVWEDERVISEGLDPRPGDRVFSITSGGCFSLQFLAYDVAEVLSLDFNPNQTALLDYKISAARALSHGELWEVLGLAASDRRETLYSRFQEALSEESRAFWDARPELVREGGTLVGKQDHYFHVVGRFMQLLQGKKTVRRFLACRTPEEQADFFDRRWSSFPWRLFCRVAFSRFVLDRAFHKDHFRYSSGGHPAERLRTVVEDVFRNVPVLDNFYLHYLFRKTYPSSEVCPTWLRESTFEELRTKLDRIQLHTGELERFLFQLDGGSVDCFNFSNLFDWVSEENFSRLMREVVRVARPGARLCYWTNIVNTKRELPRDQVPEIEENRELGDRIFSRNRTPGYSGCVVARVVK